MRNAIPLLTALALALPSAALAVPMQLNHQGRLVDSSGIGLDGTGNTLTFAVYDDASGGSPLWSETLSVTFTNGFYSAILGADEVSNPLDTTLFSSYPIYLEVTVNTDPPLSPRQELVSVPYAMLAETATNVDGGSVNANDVAINSMPVINDMGEWVGATPAIGWTDVSGIPAGFADDVDDDTLASLGCGNAEYPVYDTGSSSWGCTTISDSTLSEAEVDSFVANNGYLTLGDLADVATSGDYNDLINTPLDDDTLAALGCSTGEYPMWDGAMWTCVVPPDTQLSESEVDNYVDNNGYLTTADVSNVGLSGEYSDLLNVPPDGDTLAALGCSTGEYPMWDGAAWSCVVPPDTQLSEAEVDNYVDNNGYALSSGLASVATSGDYGDLLNVPPDADTLAALGCSAGEYPMWDGAAWTCVVPTNTQLSESEVDAFVANNGYALSSGLASVATSGDYGDLLNTPGETLTGLSCTSDGASPVWNATLLTWECDLVDTVLTESDVENYITNGVIDLAAGTTIGGQTISTGGGSLVSPVVIGDVIPGDSYVSGDTPGVIPDNNSFGFNSVQYVSVDTTIEKFTVDIDLQHPDVGDITLTLHAPSGASIVLYDGELAGQANLVGNIGRELVITGGDIYSLYGEQTLGNWRLEVIDDAAGNSGTLESWTLNFNESWSGELFVGSSIESEGDITTTGNIAIDMGSEIIFRDEQGNETLRFNGDTFWELLCDRDQDGYAAADAACGGDDCDDTEATAYPGAPGDTIAGDGIDQNCDGEDGIDADGDGFASQASGGSDCDDANPLAVYVGELGCPGASCKHILDAGGGETDGSYWLDPDGSGPFEAYCDMQTDGGGWTLLGTISGADSDNWTTEFGYWSDTNTLGSASSPWLDHKSAAWNRLSMTGAEILWQRRHHNVVRAQAVLSNNCLFGKNYFGDLFTTWDTSLKCSLSDITIVMAASDSTGLQTDIYMEGTGTRGLAGSDTNGFCWNGGDDHDNRFKGRAGWNRPLSGGGCYAEGHSGYIAPFTTGGTYFSAHATAGDIAPVNWLNQTDVTKTDISFFAR